MCLFDKRQCAGLPTPQCQKTVILMPENGNFKPKTVILKVENGNQNSNFFMSLFKHYYYLQVQIIIKNTSKTIKKRLYIAYFIQLSLLLQVHCLILWQVHEVGLFGEANKTEIPGTTFFPPREFSLLIPSIFHRNEKVAALLPE